MIHRRRQNEFQNRSLTSIGWRNYALLRIFLLAVLSLEWGTTTSTIPVLVQTSLKVLQFSFHFVFALLLPSQILSVFFEEQEYTHLHRIRPPQMVLFFPSANRCSIPLRSSMRNRSEQQSGLLNKQHLGPNRHKPDPIRQYPSFLLSFG